MTDGGVSPPGWYPDGYGGMRWWDGARWTQHYVVPQAPVEAAWPEMDTRRRVIAYLIDMLLELPFFVVYLVAFFMSFFGDAEDAPDFAVLLGAMGLMALTFAVNRGLVQGATGRSLGKRIMKVRLVRIEDGRPPGPWWGLLRAALEYFVGIVDLVLVFVLPKHQRVGDMAAKTVVLTDEQVARMFPPG